MYKYLLTALFLIGCGDKDESGDSAAEEVDSGEESGDSGEESDSGESGEDSGV